jgi:hypothetical protein
MNRENFYSMSANYSKHYHNNTSLDLFQKEQAKASLFNNDSTKNNKRIFSALSSTKSNYSNLNQNLSSSKSIVILNKINSILSTKKRNNSSKFRADGINLNKNSILNDNNENFWKKTLNQNSNNGNAQSNSANLIRLSSSKSSCNPNNNFKNNSFEKEQEGCKTLGLLELKRKSTYNKRNIVSNSNCDSSYNNKNKNNRKNRATSRIITTSRYSLNCSINNNFDLEICESSQNSDDDDDDGIFNKQDGIHDSEHRQQLDLVSFISLDNYCQKTNKYNSLKNTHYNKIHHYNHKQRKVALKKFVESKLNEFNLTSNNKNCVLFLLKEEKSKRNHKNKEATKEVPPSSASSLISESSKPIVLINENILNNNRNMSTKTLLYKIKNIIRPNNSQHKKKVDLEHNSENKIEKYSDYDEGNRKLVYRNEANDVNLFCDMLKKRACTETNETNNNNSNQNSLANSSILKNGNNASIDSELFNLNDGEDFNYNDENDNSNNLKSELLNIEKIADDREKFCLLYLCNKNNRKNENLNKVNNILLLNQEKQQKKEQLDQVIVESKNKQSNSLIEGGNDDDGQEIIYLKSDNQIENINNINVSRNLNSANNFVLIKNNVFYSSASSSSLANSSLSITHLEKEFREKETNNTTNSECSDDKQNKKIITKKKCLFKSNTSSCFDSNSNNIFSDSDDFKMIRLKCNNNNNNNNDTNASANNRTSREGNTPKRPASKLNNVTDYLIIKNKLRQVNLSFNYNNTSNALNNSINNDEVISKTEISPETNNHLTTLNPSNNSKSNRDPNLVSDKNQAIDLLNKITNTNEEIKNILIENAKEATKSTHSMNMNTKRKSKIDFLKVGGQRLEGVFTPTLRRKLFLANGCSSSPSSAVNNSSSDIAMLSLLANKARLTSEIEFIRKCVHESFEKMNTSDENVDKKQESVNEILHYDKTENDFNFNDNNNKNEATENSISASSTKFNIEKKILNSSEKKKYSDVKDIKKKSDILERFIFKKLLRQNENNNNESWHIDSNDSTNSTNDANTSSLLPNITSTNTNTILTATTIPATSFIHSPTISKKSKIKTNAGIRDEFNKNNKSLKSKHLKNSNKKSNEIECMVTNTLNTNELLKTLIKNNNYNDKSYDNNQVTNISNSIEKLNEKSKFKNLIDEAANAINILSKQQQATAELSSKLLKSSIESSNGLKYSTKQLKSDGKGLTKINPSSSALM